MGKPLVRFCEGQEFNCDMEKILWHRRESRRKQRKQTFSLSHGRLPATRNPILQLSGITGLDFRFINLPLHAAAMFS